MDVQDNLPHIYTLYYAYSSEIFYNQSMDPIDNHVRVEIHHGIDPFATLNSALMS